MPGTDKRAEGSLEESWQRSLRPVQAVPTAPSSPFFLQKKELSRENCGAKHCCSLKKLSRLHEGARNKLQYVSFLLIKVQGMAAVREPKPSLNRYTVRKPLYNRCLRELTQTDT